MHHSRPSLRSYARSSGWVLPVLMLPVICSPCAKGISQWLTSPSNSGPGPVGAAGILPLCAIPSCMVWRTTLKMNWFPILYLPHLMNPLSLLSGWTAASRPREGRGDRTPLVVSTQPAGQVPHSSSPVTDNGVEPEPMQVGRTKLTPEEREPRCKGNLCMYCGQTGHFISRCPLKDRAHL